MNIAAKLKKRVKLASVKKNTTKRIKKFNKSFQKSRLGKFSQKQPLVIVGSLLILVISLILAGNVWQKTNAQEEKPEIKVTPVKVFSLGQNPTIKVLSQVEKSNVIHVSAQTGGVINKVYVEEGDHVYRGTTLTHIASNYTGASATSLQRQISQKQYEHNKDTLQAQKDIIGQQKELAENQDINADELREITRKSVDETKDQISLSEELITSIDSQIEALNSSTATSTTSAQIQTLKSTKLQLLGGLAQLKSGLRNAEYQENGDNPPAKMSNLTREMTLKQLEIQEKALEMGLEISHLQYKLARINESLSFPASFSAGIVEAVHVRPGEMVSPGTLLFTINADSGENTLTARVSQEIAQNVSQIEPSYLHFDRSIDSAECQKDLDQTKNSDSEHTSEKGSDTNNSICDIQDSKREIYPVYVSSEATHGMSYSIKYSLPAHVSHLITDNQQLTVEIPLGMAKGVSTIPFIPIDSVYQSADQSFVFVAKEGVAVAKEVELGPIYGQFVNVMAGLENGSQVILDRNILAGDKVEIK